MGTNGPKSKPPGGRDAWGDEVGYSSRTSRDGDTHHTVYDPDTNMRVSWDTDSGGDYESGSGHAVDQSDGSTTQLDS